MGGGAADISKQKVIPILVKINYMRGGGASKADR